MKQILQSEMSDFVFCPYSVYLKGLIKDEAIPITAYAAREAWLRMGIKKLLPETFLAGPELMPVEQMRGEQLREVLGYKSAEAFSGFMGGLWLEHVIKENGKVHDRNVAFRYKNQWFKFYDEFKKAGLEIYKHFLEEGLPVLSYYNSQVEFELEAITFRTKFDEIRPGGLITSHDLPMRKVGSRKKKQQMDEEVHLTQEDINEDLKITLQMLAFSVLAQKPFFQLKFGIGPYKGAGIIREDIKYEYHNLLTGETLVTTRKESDLERLLQAATLTQERLEETRKSDKFTTNPNSCYICPYNVMQPTGTAVCDRRNNRYLPMRPISGFEK